MVHRTGGGLRARLRALQRHVGRVLLPGDHGARRRAVRLRQRRRPRRLRRAGPDARRGKPLQPGHVPAERRRSRIGCSETISIVNADGTRTLHFTDVTDAERHRHRTATAWASRPATSTTTAASISTSPASAAASLFRNNGDGTFTDVTEAERHRRSAAAGACRRRSSTTTATAGSTCSSATT